MHRKIVRFAPLLLAGTLAGCYHAVVETGRAPNGQVVEQEWAHSFIGGLIPPSVVETASQCPNGVARVETQHSFLNMLAAGLTFGLYSPITITVACAGPTAFDDDAPVLRAGTPADAARSLARAVEMAKDSGDPVFVRFAE
jgi:Bor protein